MQTVKIICVGKLKDRFYSQASDEYVKRLGAYCKTEIIEIPAAQLYDESESAIGKAIETERDKILKSVSPNETVVAMCVEGKRLDSVGFSKLLEKAAMSGGGDIAFIIGGSYGLSDRVKSRADVRLSMSDMTFPHTLARIMLLEQIYRGYTIIQGKTYHK